MGKYDAWRDHLNRQTAANVVMSFDELDELSSLPASAHKYDWWWANEDLEVTTHVQCKSWQSAGYEAHPDLGNQTVTFVRKRLAR
jgi:hypothetical protein